MEARAYVISREIIKPSSQTPNHLKKLKLSSLDQLLPSFYIPLIFFYQADDSNGLNISNHAQISQKLKHSLAHTLPSFYPLAGRFEDEFVVDCNDAGVEFIDARIHAHLIDTIKDDPNVEDLKQCLPINPTSAGCPDKGPLFLAQVTFFDCGGIAIAICFAHNVADCESMTAFLNAWASKSRGEGFEIPRHFSFDLSNYFPPLDFSTSPVWELTLSNDKFVTKRFVFDKEKLALLKQAAKSSPGSIVKDPTRVEVVSAFIWKIFLGVAELNNDDNIQAIKILAAIHLVNLRARTSPSRYLANVFGNCLMLALAISDINEGVEEFHELATKMRRSIRKIDGDYIKEAQSEPNYLGDLYKFLAPFAEGEMDWCCFSSWCRFPLYDVDYGWGKPVWLCAAALPIKNLVILVSSKCGDNIEAWVNMKQEHLEMLETKIKLICTDK